MKSMMDARVLTQRGGPPLIEIGQGVPSKGPENVTKPAP